MRIKKITPLKGQLVVEFKEKKMFIAYLLWFCLGIVGAHRFYLNKGRTAVAQLLMGTLGAYLIFPLFILSVWWLVDIYYVYKYTSEHNKRRF